MQNYVIWILTALFIQIRTKDFDKNFAEYGKKKRFDTSNYEADKPLPKGMNKKVIGLLKEKTRREDYDRNFALRLKTYSYWMDDGSEHKRAKGTKKGHDKKRN